MEQLENQGHTCFLPTALAETMRRGKREARSEPLFFRYLFIRLNASTSNWRAVRSTRGVSGLVAFGGRYATLPDDWVDALRSVPPAMRRRLFEPGESVAIASGPLAGLQGIYQAADGDARAVVLVELMSQPQKLMIAIDMLRRAA
ncbi:MAG: transcriptional regulator [Herminiimonas sp.]|nr:transcriptional regulator [Herminiimonas sp.]